MLTHAQIWNALDRLAARAGLSASGLAKKAGLDPTTFNKSKRITPDGHARWPWTESVAKSLAATGTPIDVFVQLISDGGDVVLAADASHLYTHIDGGRVFPLTYNIEEVVEGYETLKKLASAIR